MQNGALSIINYTKMRLFYSNATKLGDFVDLDIFSFFMTFDERDTSNLGFGNTSCGAHCILGGGKRAFVS